MCSDMDELIQRWNLSLRDTQQFSPSKTTALTRLKSVEVCLDIDEALAMLLENRNVIRTWLRTPHRAFFHTPPLAIALCSTTGRSYLRSLLLLEAANQGDPAARATIATW